jgi:hypothetical protein
MPGGSRRPTHRSPGVGSVRYAVRSGPATRSPDRLDQSRSEQPSGSTRAGAPPPTLVQRTAPGRSAGISRYMPPSLPRAG